MQIGVKKREKRELVDRLEFVRSDHARSLEVVEIARERLRPGLEGAREVSGEDRQAPRAQAHPEVPAGQTQPEAGRGDERRRREGRDRQVVGDHRRHVRELALRCGEQVSPVVVVDRPARHPGIRGGHPGKSPEGAQEREVHELFLPEDRRARGADDEQDGRRAPEQRGRELLLVPPDPGPQGLVGRAAPGVPCRATDQQECEDRREALETEGRQKRQAPGDVGDEHEAEGPREQGRVPTVAEDAAEDRQDGEAQDLGRQGPCQNVPHVSGRHCRRAAAFGLHDRDA